MSNFNFTGPQLAFLLAQRVGRLASADLQARPHVIPVCFAPTLTSIYIALDAKPKRVAPTALKRVQNILANPQVALVFDHYAEDWSSLAYLLVHGTATLIPVDLAEHARALVLLRDRYPQYNSMPLEDQPVIAIHVHAASSWGF